MRIRKHASKLLFSSPQSLPTSFQSPSCDAAAAAAASAASSTPYPRANATSSNATARALPLVLAVCQLNQSPWDALSPETYCRHHHHHRQETEVGEEEDCGLSPLAALVDDAAAVVKGRNGYSSAAVNNRNQTRPKYEEEVDEHMWRKREKELQPQQKLHSRKKTNATTKNKKNATTAATNYDKRTTKVRAPNATAMEETGRREDDHRVDATTAPIAGATAMVMCKKSDGKGWHCKREAKHPHSLCNYHLSQIRSYYHATHHHHLLPHRTPDEKNNANPKKKEKPKVTAASRSDEPEFYYYYSGFGPWRGKRRGAPGEETSNKQHNGGVADASATTNATVVASLAVHGGIEDGDDDGLDPESIDDVEDSSSDDVGPMKRRKGRKPIKARSLKSLL